jgi:hypothetical protein
MALHILKDITKSILVAAPVLLVVVACNRASTPPAYGERTQYTEGQPLSFPDVTLEFLGKRRAPGSTEFPRGMTFFDFKAHEGDQAQLVSWTAGTGDIGPTLFELAGSRYALELAMSDKLGSLDEDELVLWREVIPAFEASTATPITTPASPPRVAQDYYDRGFVQFAAGLTEEAVASFTQAITVHPTYVEAYQFRGNAYCQLGRYDLARADYEQVLVLEPQPEIQATVTAALQEIAQAESIAPTHSPALPTPAPLAPPVEITLDQPFRLALDQVGWLDSAGLGIKFHEMIEDTRCPRQVECEIPGWARISIYAWVTNIEPIEFNLYTDPATNSNVVPYGEYQIRLLRLEPYPETPESNIAPQDYRATFVVSK